MSIGTDFPLGTVRFRVLLVHISTVPMGLRRHVGTSTADEFAADEGHMEKLGDVLENFAKREETQWFPS